LVVTVILVEVVKSRLSTNTTSITKPIRVEEVVLVVAVVLVAVVKKAFYNYN